MNISGGDTFVTRVKRANFFSVPPTGRVKKYICPPHREGPKYFFFFRNSTSHASLKDVRSNGGGGTNVDDHRRRTGKGWGEGSGIRRTSTNAKVKKKLCQKRKKKALQRLPPPTTFTDCRIVLRVNVQNAEYFVFLAFRMFMCDTNRTSVIGGGGGGCRVGLFSKQTKFDKGGRGSKKSVFNNVNKSPNNVNKSIYSYTIKCMSTFFYKLKLTDSLWYRDIGWYRDTLVSQYLNRYRSWHDTKC